MMIPLLTSTTTLPKLMAGFAAIRLPYKFIFTFGVAMRLVPLVTSTYFDIMASQRLRGHDISQMNYFKRLIKGYVPLFIPLVLTMLRRTADMDVAIESRGFGAPVARTYLEDIRPSRADILALGVAAIIFSGIFVYLYLNHGSQMGLIIQMQ
jgi:energy-coupling factor transporter transmembrane protein EcfT